MWRWELHIATTFESIPHTHSSRFMELHAIRLAVRVLTPLVDNALRETHARQYSLLECEAVGAWEERG